MIQNFAIVRTRETGQTTGSEQELSKFDLRSPRACADFDKFESLTETVTVPRKFNTVTLPCETKSREFDSKLLLACILAERGWRVIVGSRNHIHLSLGRMPRSVYLGKDVRHSSRHIARMAKWLGHRFVAQDEEGLVYYSREHYRHLRVDPFVFKSCEALLAWGPDNALAWSEASHDNETPIHVTGNGRVDLMLPELRRLHEPEVQELRNKHGNFILVNTNFGSLNHFYTNLTALKPPEELKDSSSWEAGLSRHRYAIFRAFLAMLPRLAARFPATKFILRPHPGENHQTWIKASQGAKNILVSNEGGVIPWILASKAVIHNSCTTGIEAYVLGGQPIAFQPEVSQAYDLHLANDLSQSVHDEMALFDLVESVILAKANSTLLRTPERNALLARHISATDGELASERIADILTTIASKKQSKTPFGPKWLAGFIYAETRALLKRLQMNRSAHKSNSAYTKHRFPETPLAEVQQRIADFSRAMGRFENVEASAIRENIFAISLRRGK